MSFGYCFVRGPSYSNDEVESPSFAFDYILYFACLVLAATLAFIETRFEIFHGWDTHLLIAALVFGVLAYRFDNRFVLSLALSTLAGYLGLKISGFDTLDTDRLRLAGFLYGAFLIGIGVLLKRMPHQAALPRRLPAVGRQRDSARGAHPASSTAAPRVGRISACC